jgi:hypothetical protein
VRVAPSTTCKFLHRASAVPGPVRERLQLVLEHFPFFHGERTLKVTGDGKGGSQKKGGGGEKVLEEKGEER